jgi:hypothetical protein
MKKIFEFVVETWEEHLSPEEAMSMRRTFYRTAICTFFVVTALIVVATLYYR